MEREDAIEDGVDGLAMGEGVLDEADVARGGGRVEAETGDCGGVSGGRGERKGRALSGDVVFYLQTVDATRLRHSSPTFASSSSLANKSKRIGLVIVLIHNTVNP